MTFPLEIMLAANAVLLALAVIAALVMMRASVKYQRSIGESDEQQRQTKIIINTVLALIVIGVIAAGLNLFST